MPGGLLQIHDPLKPRGHAVGIDLGTTNSLVAAVVDGKPRAFPVDEDGSLLLPSVVNYAADGAVLVGARARALAAVEPTSTIASVKRFMGKGPDDAETRALGAYKFAPGALGGPVRGEGRAPGDADRGLGGDPPRAEAAGGGRAHRQGGAGGHHRPGVLRRRPAPGHARRRAARRPRGAAAPQRAHRGGARLRARQGKPGDVRGLRPRRRDVRHLHPPAGGRRVPGEVDGRRLGARRGRLRPGHRRPLPRGARAGPGRRAGSTGGDRAARRGAERQGDADPPGDDRAVGARADVHRDPGRDGRAGSPLCSSGRGWPAVAR